MKNKKRGFTLIELLVVVLIIGILAAVALPQYQKAVDRSRWTPLMQMERTISRAQELYYMANGSYAYNFTDLDISYPNMTARNCANGDVRAAMYTESGKPYLQVYRINVAKSSYLDINLLTFYYSSPKRVYRQCRPAYGTPNKNWQDLCKFIMGPQAKVLGNGWVVIEE